MQEKSLISFFRFCVLGIGAAVMALFAQVLVNKHFHQETLSTLLVLTALEEAVRFSVLLLAHRKKLIPQKRILAGIAFGIGFALTEITLSENRSLAHSFLLFCVHIFLSTLILLGLRFSKTYLVIATFVLAILLHTLYNTSVWFAHF